MGILLSRDEAAKRIKILEVWLPLQDVFRHLKKGLEFDFQLTYLSI